MSAVPASKLVAKFRRMRCSGRNSPEVQKFCKVCPVAAQIAQHVTSRRCVSSWFRGSTGNTSKVHTCPKSLQALQCLITIQLDSSYIFG